MLQVKIWFQNRRTKWKKHDNVNSVEVAEHKPPGGKPEAAQTVPSSASKKSGSSSGGDGEGDEHSSMDGSESCYSVDSKPAIPPSPSPPAPGPLLCPAQTGTPPVPILQSAPSECSSASEPADHTSPEPSVTSTPS